MLFLLNLALGSVFAQDTNNSIQEVLESFDYNIDFIVENTLEAKELFNSNLDQVPDFVKDNFGTENIHFKILDENNSIYKEFSVVTKNGFVENISLEKLKSYTLEIKLPLDKANKLISNKSSLDELKTYIKEGDLSFKGRGFFSSIKYFFVNLISKFI